MKNQWLYKVSAALMIVMLAVAALPVMPARAATDTFTTTGAGTWTAPAGVTSITVEVWGGGGRGGSFGGGGAEAIGGGGGGGAYSRSVVTVVPGTTYNLFVGAGSNSTAAGGDSWFINATTVMAKGGNSSNSGTGATGGDQAVGVGSTKFSGGAGANGSAAANYGGGGGSSAGTALLGTNATVAAGAIAPAGGGNGGAGKTTPTGNGTNGVTPGGGGGGAYRSGGGGGQNGGAGANGQVVITYTETVPPVLNSFTRQTPATNPTNQNTLVFRATFNEAVLNVSATDFTVTGTTATVTTVTPVSVSVYDITVTGGDLAGLNGTVGLNLAAGQNITDTSANPLPTTEPAIDETYAVDNAGPSVISLAIQNPVASPTNANTLVYRLTFSENVINIDGNDFDVTGGTTATVTAVTTVTANTVFDLTVSGGDINGFNGIVTVGFDITGGGQQNITDTAGNALPNPNNTASYTLDNVAPTVTINQAGGQADPTSNSPINFTVVFNEAPAGFATGDVTFPAPNTAGGTLVGAVTGGPTTFNVAVTGMTTAGNVVPSILAGVATDAAGNNNVAATFTDRTVAFIPKVNTTTTVNCVPNPVLAFAPTTCTVSVTRVSGTNSPSGTVALGSTGSGTFTPAVTCTLVGAGATTSCSVTYTPSAVGSGTHAISANYGGDVNFNASSGNQNLTVNQATSSVTMTCPLVDQPYSGSAQTPCTASYSTSDGLSGSLTPTYSNNTNAGIASASASYTGDADHAASNNSANFTISQVSSTVAVTCPVAAQPFTGSAQTPCTAEVTGIGMTPVDVTASIVYSNNTNVGAATADVSWPGDINHTGNTGSGGFVIGQASSTVIVSCPVSVAYNGAALTPCTAEATGAGMTPVDVTASLVYSNNTNVGTATADASWAGDASHTGNIGTDTFDITPAAQTITVTTNAPATASNGSMFNVAATASSGEIVSITALGACTVVDNGNGTADITMTSGTGTCSVFYDQAGNANYSAASQIQQDVTATEGPVFTSADNTSFDMGFPGSFTVTAVGNPMTMTITSVGSLPAGVTLTDNGDGTATLAGIPGVGTNGTYNLAFTANNGVSPNGTQAFTLTVKNGPIVSANGINSTPDTGDGKVGENESIIDTLGITTLTVQFSQDVYDDPTDVLDYAHDATNPANYILVRSTTASFATIDCAGGVLAPDVRINVNSVTYSNGGGSGPFVSTLSINDGFPLNIVGFYRLFVCGTTSIVDASNRGLELAGNGTTPGTDFQRNFRIATVVAAGGGDGSGSSSVKKTQVTSIGGFLIPVTGFAPDQITTLPVQPADKAYSSLGQMTIEIPTLGIKFPIVGASITNKTWDLTWLQNNVAYLEGSAYPTTAGNSVLTAHVQDANKNLGPFSDIKGMKVGQNIYIHVNGQVYVYQVQESRKVSQTSIDAMFKHEEDSWITLVTCEDYNAKTGVYASRRMVRAVLISVIPEKK